MILGEMDGTVDILKSMEKNIAIALLDVRNQLMSNGLQHRFDFTRNDMIYF